MDLPRKTQRAGSRLRYWNLNVSQRKSATELTLRGGTIKAATVFFFVAAMMSGCQSQSHRRSAIENFPISRSVSTTLENEPKDSPAPPDNKRTSKEILPASYLQNVSQEDIDIETPLAQQTEQREETPPRPEFEASDSDASDSAAADNEVAKREASDNETTNDSIVGRAATDEQLLSTEPSVAGVKLLLDEVLNSTLSFYPEIDAVLQELEIADGQLLGAQGNFDTKLKASSENTPVGFYETYRSQFGVEQPTFNGGSLFAGYRFGRGDIEPWYLERNTNAGGELKLGGNWALLRGRQIDARRVALWQSDIKRKAVEPVVRQQLLKIFLDAEVTYWNWVAAGQIYSRTAQLYKVAQNRVEGLEKRIEAGDLAEIVRTDNERTILSREVKLIKARAKLQQSAVKLSLYLRDSAGRPIVPDAAQLPELTSLDYELQLGSQQRVSEALRCRPELELINLDIRKIDLDLAKAENDLLPKLDAQVALSQDFGRPTSASAVASSSTQTLFVNFDEKDEFQVDIGVSWSQNLQRRKVRGKIRSLQGKRSQLEIKRQFLEQKIAATVEQNYQLTLAAKEQIQAAQRSLQLAQRLSEATRKQIETGDKDLFEIILREQQELNAAVELIASQFNFYSNRAQLNFSVGCDDNQFYNNLLRQ